jgi:carboxymethylenebutenolidase
VIAAAWITLKAHDGHRFAVWQATPSAQPLGAVVVIQEIFGVNQHIQGVAQRVAQAGFLALAPAVLDRAEANIALGYSDADVQRGRALVAQVGFDNALRDVAATAQYGAAAGKVAVMGFCWGGTAALLCATRLKLPAVSYYGGRSMPFLHERLSAPLLLHFGERDPLIPPDQRERIIAAFPEAEAEIYPAGHGFNCEARQDYDAACAERAWARSLDFLRGVLAR